MVRKIDSLPSDAAALTKLLVTTRAELFEAEARAQNAEVSARNAEARAKALALQIEKMKFTIAKLRHEHYGPSSERHAVLEQLELELAEMEEAAAESETQAQIAARNAREKKIVVQAFERRRPARRPLPEHLPRERVVEPAPASCPCCGGTNLRKIGEDVTETLEVIPRRWKVIQHVREKFSCRACDVKSLPIPTPVSRPIMTPCR